MISKELFLKTISVYQSFSDRMEKISDFVFGKNSSLNLCECDWYEQVDSLFDCFLQSHFTDDAIDTIYWWLFEDVDKVIYINKERDIFNKDEIKEEVPVRTLGQLYDFFMREPEAYFLNV